MSKNPLFNPLLDPPEPADFGKGFTLCIFKFLEHTHQHDDILGMPSIGPFSNVQLWFNGSSDHFYQLQIPPGWETRAKTDARYKFVKDILKIASRALGIGHGFKGGKIDMTDYEKAVQGCTKVLVDLDHLYGQSFFWNLAGIVTTSFEDTDEEEFRRKASSEYICTLRFSSKTSPEISLLTMELEDLIQNKKASPCEINQKVFEIAVAFDIEVGIEDANTGVH